MSLSAGTRLGPYEILGPIGAGGMGEVYRARDTGLDRDVAVKVLPEAFATDPDRLARFAREAKVLASLNHPNIAAIDGLEHAGSIQALILELVEGPTLADRIAQGPIPLDEAVPIARQIVDAVEAAHAQGIVHRDLKPANIKLTAGGPPPRTDEGHLEPSALARIDPGLLAKNGPPHSPCGEHVGVLGRVKGALAPLGGCAALDPPCALQPVAVKGNGANWSSVPTSLGAEHHVL